MRLLYQQSTVLKKDCFQIVSLSSRAALVRTELDKLESVSWLECSRRLTDSEMKRIGTRFDAVGVFFFQAEDGIRDLTVTGVQTCALPISTHVPCFTYSRVSYRASSISQRSAFISRLVRGGSTGRARTSSKSSSAAMRLKRSKPQPRQR